MPEANPTCDECGKEMVLEKIEAIHSSPLDPFWPAPRAYIKAYKCTNPYCMKKPVQR